MKTLLKRSLIITLALLMLLIAAMPVFALTASTYVSQVFSTGEGLPTGEANTILQSSEGYIWIGSYGGLIRYDGSTFVNYADKLGTSSIRALYEDSKGRLFVGTNDLGVFLLEGSEFVHITAKNPSTFLSIRDFTHAMDGTIYVASTTGIGKIVDNEIIPVEFPAMIGESFVGIARDSYGYISAVADSGNVHVFLDDKYIHLYTSDELFDEGLATCITSSRKGGIYIGNNGNEVVRVTTTVENRDITKYNYSTHHFTTGDVHSIARIQCVTDDVVLISSINGFGYLDTSGNFKRIDKAGDNAIAANWAIEDYEGNIWVASSNYGVIRYSLGCFDNVNDVGALEGVTANIVYKAGNTYYVGTDSGLLVFDENWKPIRIELQQYLYNTRVRNITGDKDGNVWFATYSKFGALRYNPETGAIKGFGAKEGLLSERVRVVYPLSDGRMLVGNQLGCNIIDGDEIVASYSSEDGMSTPSILCAMELDGRIFLGTDGSGIFEITDHGLENYSMRDGLAESVILRMCPDTDNRGNYFICAGDNLYYSEHGKIRVLDKITKGAGSVYCVYDRADKIWILQDGGVYAADKLSVLSDNEDTYTLHYGAECGLTGSLSANTWNYLSPEGSLYLPTRNGVSIFYFEGVDITPPYAIVNSVLVDDVLYDRPKSIELSGNARRMTVDVAALLFTETAEYTIGYQLVGFDDTESFTNEKHASISYTNLPGGDYTFSMRIINPLTGEDEYNVQMPVHKQAKLTEHWWFWGLLFVLVIGIVMWIMSARNKAKLRAMEAHQQELRELTEQSLLTVARTIDAKDRYTNGHSKRVAIYAREIARRMGYSEHDQQRIYFIGLMHDIGKIGVPDDVLNKPGRLTDQERLIIQRHPLIGGDILSDFKGLDGIADGARYHHERFDGKGYNEGLSGYDIPVEARIIGIADTYDAMASTRVYRPGLTSEVILGELKKGAGTQFDPDIVPYMIQMIDDGFAPIE